MLAFGSFGVPIKSDAAVSVDIDPLVFQSYKTFMCFITSWLVLLAGEEFVFSPWGIVSGLFWVPGGVATIYAVKSAGLAIGIGIGSSFIVLVSFVWGIFIFDEHVHSRFGACVAIASLMLGLFGMSYYSSPESQQHIIIPLEDSLHGEISSKSPPRLLRYQGVGSRDEDEDAAVDLQPIRGNTTVKLSERTHKTVYSDSPSSVSDKSAPTAIEGDDDDGPVAVVRSDVLPSPQPQPSLVLCGIKFTKRQLGMLSAVFCGLWGGSIMAPMKWCPADTKGTHYLLSFAIGSSIVTLSLWLFRYIYYVYKYDSTTLAYDMLPSFHLRAMWLQGGISGLLWSIGNFFSLIAVFYLGEGVGYPLVQTSILVSGLWGIFYFKEVTGTKRIAKWFAASLLTIFGILLLSYEHHEQ